MIVRNVWESKFCTQKVHTQGLDHICNSDLGCSASEK